jgi:hypothetical protein
MLLGVIEKPQNTSRMPIMHMPRNKRKSLTPIHAVPFVNSDEAAWSDVLQ